MGIYLPGTLSLNATANAGIDPPAPNFVEGSAQSYTFSVDAPSTTAQTITVTLSGAIPSDFEATVGDTIEQLNANGTFRVTLAAGETNVSFGLQDITADTGSSDIASGATLQLAASLPNPDTLVGGTIQATPITFSYVSQGVDTAPPPLASDVITGQYNSGNGVTTYTGDGGEDSIAATGSMNLVNAQNSGNDSIVAGSGTNTINGSAGNDVISSSGTQDSVVLGSGFDMINGGSGQDVIQGSLYGGDDIVSANGGTDVVDLGNGTSEIYANSKVNLAQAIAQASTAVATGAEGDLLSVLDGSNTVVGGDGNDLVTAGTGHDVVVLGPGHGQRRIRDLCLPRELRFGKVGLALQQIEVHGLRPDLILNTMLSSLDARGGGGDI